MKNEILYYVLSFALGIFLITYYPISWGFLFLFAFIAVGLVLANKFLFWKKSNLYILLLLLVLGAIRQQVNLEQINKYDSHLLNKNREFVGLVCEEPVLREGYTDYLIKVMRSNDRINEVEGSKVLVKVKNIEKGSSDWDFTYGDTVKVTGYIKAPSPPTNPAQFNYLAYCRQRGITGLMYSRVILPAPEEEGLGVNLIFNNIMALKGKLNGILQSNFSEEDYHIVEGLIFGGSRGLKSEFRNDLQKTGIIHILSVSGFHVSLLAAGIFLLTNIFRLGKKPTLIIVLTILSIYIIMTGFRPSVIRASLIITLPLIGYSLGRKSHWLSSLSVAGLVLLIWNPANLFMTGTQLSMAATWGILYLTSPIRQIIKFLPENLQIAVAVTLAAQISTLPILVYNFNYISVVSIATNLLFVPIITAIIFLVFLTMLLGSILMPVAQILSFSAAGLLYLLKYAVWYTGNLPFAVINIKTTETWQIIIFYCLFTLAAMLYHKRSLYFRCLWFYKKHRYNVALVGLIFVVIITWQGILWPNQEMKVTFLDVGEGDCAVILTPSEEVIVIDTGGPSGTNKNFNPAKSILVPYLRSLGVQAVDLLVLSHFHSDHLGGVTSLVREFPTRAVLVPDIGNKNIDENKEAKQVLALIKEKNIKIIKGQIGEQINFQPDLKMLVLGPPDNLFAGTNSDDNNNSLVLKLMYRDISYLFTGDIENEAINLYCLDTYELGEKPNVFRATVLKVPHHGSKGSLNKDFYEKVKPENAVISVGRNFYGHPNEEVINSLAQQECSIYRTDNGGAVLTSTQGKIVNISTFGGNEN